VKSLLKRIIPWVCLLVMVSVQTDAQETWVGGGANNNWSTDGNWLDGTAPANPYSGTVYLGPGGLGAPNVVDLSREVGALEYTNQSAASSHVTDLGANTLIIGSGVLSAGRALGLPFTHKC